MWLVLTFLVTLTAGLAWLAVSGWRRLWTASPRSLLTRGVLLALYAYLIVSGAIVLWMWHVERLGSHTAVVLYCAALMVPALFASTRGG